MYVFVNVVIESFLEDLFLVHGEEQILVDTKFVWLLIFCLQHFAII